MGREIKFRAWHNNEMIIDVLVDETGVWDQPTERSYSLHRQVEQLEKAIPMQFVGHQDKNGIDIYEGDILSCNPSDNPDDHIFGEVKYQDCGFVCFDHNNPDSDNALYYKSEMLQVIGNIYENPDLLDFHCIEKDTDKGQCKEQCPFCANV